MKFARPRRKNPFDSPFVSVALHLLAAAGGFACLWWSFRAASPLPLVIFLVICLPLEGMLLYFRLRR